MTGKLGYHKFGTHCHLRILFYSKNTWARDRSTEALTTFSSQHRVILTHLNLLLSHNEHTMNVKCMTDVTGEQCHWGRRSSLILPCLYHLLGSKALSDTLFYVFPIILWGGMKLWFRNVEWLTQGHTEGYLKYRSSRLKPIICFLEKVEDEKPYFCSLYLPFLISVGLRATYHWE